MLFDDVLHEMCNFCPSVYLNVHSLSSQSVSTSDASAEVAVFCNVNTEPREAAAAGPPSTSALQLHPGSGRQQHPSSSERRALPLPSGPHGNRRRQDNSHVLSQLLWLTVASSCFQEFYVPCTLSRKPLLILHFILRMKLSPILCFTNSREAAHRLGITQL